MDYEFSPEELGVIDDTGRVVRETLSAAPPLERLDPGGMRDLERQLAFNLGPTGYTEYGLSAGKPFGAAAMAAMSGFAANTPPLFIMFEMGMRVFGRLVAGYGNAGQKQAFLDPLVKGEITAAVAVCEKTMNIVNDPLETKGERDGETVRVSGEKGFVVSGLFADVIAVAGRLDDGIGVFLIDREMPGVKFATVELADDYRHLCPCKMVLDDCVVPADRVIGPVGGHALLSSLRLWEDQVLVAAAVGMMDAALFEATLHAKSHRSGGKPVIAYQEVGFKLAEMHMLSETSRLMAYKAGWLDSKQDREGAVFTDCAKVFCAESAGEVAGGALRVLSLKGFEPGSLACSAYKWSKYVQVSGTSTEIARMRIGDDAL